jgi:hypothetical protein
MFLALLIQYALIEASGCHTVIFFGFGSKIYYPLTVALFIAYSGIYASNESMISEDASVLRFITDRFQADPNDSYNIAIILPTPVKRSFWFIFSSFLTSNWYLMALAFALYGFNFYLVKVTGPLPYDLSNILFSILLIAGYFFYTIQIFDILTNVMLLVCIIQFASGYGVQQTFIFAALCSVYFLLRWRAVRRWVLPMQNWIFNHTPVISVVPDSDSMSRMRVESVTKLNPKLILRRKKVSTFLTHYFFMASTTCLYFLDPNPFFISTELTLYCRYFIIYYCWVFELLHMGDTGRNVFRGDGQVMRFIVDRFPIILDDAGSPVSWTARQHSVWCEKAIKISVYLYLSILLIALHGLNYCLNMAFGQGPGHLPLYLSNTLYSIL